MGHIIWYLNENKDECFHGLQFDPFNEFYFAGYNKIGAGPHRVRIWDIRKISTTSVNTHSVAEKIFDQPIKKIQYSPVRWGFLGILTGLAGEGKIHVIENHLASNDNEEDVIFDQVDFKGMRFTYRLQLVRTFMILGVLHLKIPCDGLWVEHGGNLILEINGGFSDFCWSTIQHRETSLIAIDQAAKPVLHFIPEIQSVTEHAGIIITNDLVMVSNGLPLCVSRVSYPSEKLWTELI